MTRFSLHYSHIVSYDLLFKDHFTNVMQLPKLHLISLNSGLGLTSLYPSGLFTVLLALESITFRRPFITRSKKSIDHFKLRFNTPLGCKLTLRSSHSFFFFHRLVHFVLPRLDDLSFLSSSLSPSLSFSRLTLLPSLPLVSFFLSSFFPSPSFPSLYKRFSFDHFSFLPSKIQYFFRFLRFHSSFLPFSKFYFSLPFSDSLVTFFLLHSFVFSSPSSSSPFSFSSSSFGLSDFFTSFSTDFDKFHASSGLDITFVIRFSSHFSLSRPFYFLSFFQMPL